MKNYLKQFVEDCAAALIKDADNQHCEINPLKLSAPIVQSSSAEYTVTIHHRATLKVQRWCSHNEYAIIKEASLVKIPPNCGICIGKFETWNKEEILPTNPLTLPLIQFEKFKINSLNVEPLQLFSLDIEKLNIQKGQIKLENTLEEEIHPIVWNSATTLTMLAVFFFSVLWIEFLKKFIKHLC
ncbi:hypothetical protein ABEB36_013480 [Hypothenemus hampei]|uniref:Uncharacterized protein n=1 Tax=Hypothenemus hampei TaxID=57062 RepID=A0ABD1E4L5_HYPHA